MPLPFFYTFLSVAQQTQKTTVSNTLLVKLGNLEGQSFLLKINHSKKQELYLKTSVEP